MIQLIDQTTHSTNGQPFNVSLDVEQPLHVHLRFRRFHIKGNKAFPISSPDGDLIDTSDQTVDALSFASPGGERHMFLFEGFAAAASLVDVTKPITLNVRSGDGTLLTNFGGPKPATVGAMQLVSIHGGFVVRG